MFSTIGTVFGWLGICIYLVIILTYGRLLKNNESAFLHLLICFVFIFWLPIPLSVYLIDYNPIFLAGALFGTLFLSMLIITMAFQVGHLSYSSRQTDRQLWDERDNWMMEGMLGDVYESIVNLVFHIWILIMAVGFFYEQNYLIGTLMALASLLIIRSLFLLLNRVIMHPTPIFSIFKMNAVWTNLETLITFLILIIWMTVRI